LSKRDYGQFCGLAAGLDVIGERWTLLVIRELLIGPARFNEMIENMPGIGPEPALRPAALAHRWAVSSNRPRSPATATGETLPAHVTGEQLRDPVLGLARWASAS